MKPDLSCLPEWSRPWAEHRLAQASYDISREQWGGLGDWLTTLPIERPKMPLKLHKLTMAQALEASVLWHTDMARQSERIRVDQASFGGDPDAVQVLADGGQGWRWVRVTSPEGLDYEGNAMGHCVGRGGYDEGKTIISLRDKHNMPHCTIEWHEKKRIVKQVQGRANRSVADKYQENVGIFINGLEPLAVQNAGKFGHVFVKGQLVYCNKLPDGLTLQELDLSGCTALTQLPDGLTAKYISIRRCTSLSNLPDGLTAETLDILGCTGLTQLPDGLTAKHLDIRGCTALTHLPERLNAETLYLNGCTSLRHLPDGLSAQYLTLSGCIALTQLPDGLNAQCIDLSGCTGITHLPDGLSAEYIKLSDCTGLTHLPDGLIVEELDLKGCTGLTHLPDGLTAEYLDLWGCTGLTHLPNGLNENCRVRGGYHLVPGSTPRI